jgi:type VI secretion system secreted protein Hcp
MKMSLRIKNIRAGLGWATVAVVLLIPVFTVSGAVDMFLKLGDIQGESQDKDHRDEIDVLAWSWGMSNSGTTHDGLGGGGGKVSVQDLSVTKWIDKSSPSLMLHALNGRHISDGQLVVRKAGKVPLEYIKLELKDIIVTSISTGGSGGEERLTENISLNFGAFKLTYTEQLETGEAGPKHEVIWNIAENKQGF